MPNRKSYGRVLFPGNPWPDGHAVTQCEWTARVERGTGIWFDLHLATENYYATDKKPRDGDDTDGKGRTDWTSKCVWCNYHSCMISSIYWKGQGQGSYVPHFGEAISRELSTCYHWKYLVAVRPCFCGRS